MSGNRAGLRDRLRGAGATGLFGAVTAGPQELFDSGAGWDVLLAMAVGAVAGGAVGFAFPSVLRRGRRERPPVPPPHPPPPPPEPRA
ncbi:hypothetical protein ACF08O_04985 [Streptomyces paradoxus]|uniref:hypothetical protein n=1 Tax=Streptomyces paradoxus TaxID=66375 RepID=UPI0036F96C71